MFKVSSEYKIAYYNISQLENRLNKENLRQTLWFITKSRLKNELKNVIPNSEGMVLNFIKDQNPEKDAEGNNTYNGVLIVAATKELSEKEMQVILTGYKLDNPSIVNPDTANNTINTPNVIISTEKSNENQDNHKHDNLIDLSKEKEDLNRAAKNLKTDNLIFGVIDDINHLEFISNIEDVEIIKNFGDFKKVYFSIPSFKQDEVLAHSVTILKQIKCRRALEDFII